MPIFLRILFKDIIKTEYSIALLLSCFILALTLINQSWNEFVIVADQTIQSIPSSASWRNTQLASAEGADTLTQGLVGWWKFDEGSGTSVADASGNVNNGTLTNGPTWTTDGKVGGGALSFNGSTQSILIGSASTLNITSSVTVSAWVKFSIVPGFYKGIVGRGVITTGSSNAQYALSINASGKLSFLVGSGSTQYRAGEDIIPVAMQWYHLVGVYNSVAQTISLYVNGQLDKATIAGPASLNGGTLSGYGSVVLGKPYAQDYYLNGSLDDVRVYNRVLTSAEVLELYSQIDNANEQITVKIGDVISTPSTPSAPKSAVIQVVAPASSTTQAPVVTWYVDNSVSNSGDGKSWTTAWKDIADIKNVSAGDVVYISGGPSGSSQIYYARSWVWQPAGGAPGNPITYQIGQDPLHNGTAVFDGSNIAKSYWLAYPDWNSRSNVNNVVISGDAGDGQRHFTVQNYSWGAMVCNFCQNLRIAYTTFTGGNAASMYFSTVSGIELDHNYIYVSNPAADTFSYGSFNLPLSWDQAMRFHNNLIYIPAGAGGAGADGLQWHGSGFSIYNNTFVAYKTDYTGSQHMDGWQGGGGSYIKIYGNIFNGITNYAIYADGYSGSFSHLKIYNNIVESGGGGIVLSTYKDSISWNDIVVANNVVADFSAEGHQSIVAYIKGYKGTVSDYYVENNVVVNGWAYSWLSKDDNRIIAKNNVFITAADAPANFVSYTPYGGLNNDFHLKSAATSLINQGADLSPYFTTDKDGISRPQGAGWDIGAYEYVGSGQAIIPPPPNPNPLPIVPPTPITGDFNSDDIVNSIDLSLMITAWNTNNATYDLNRDGRVNSLDYVVMVRNWSM